MNIKIFLATAGLACVQALHGIYYQIYSDRYVAQYIQPQLSCITAVFDIHDPPHGFYSFNGYNHREKKISQFQGGLHAKDAHCFLFTKTVPHINKTICVYSVMSDDTFIIATNQHHNISFVLTKLHPSEITPHEMHDAMYRVNTTLDFYDIPKPLIKTLHENCFFYPPRE
jgi:hypothetical protein